MSSIPLQVVLHTNSLVSALRSKRGASFKLLSLLGTGSFQTHLSVPLVFGYEDVLSRHQQELGRSSVEIQDFLDYVCSTATHHDVYFLWRPFLSDPDDDMVLDLAVNAGCSYIVTYNLRRFRGLDFFGLEAITAQILLAHLEALS
ncbi:MAG: PIN domain-containing protein [Candidatus Latescibacteria bacterium]|nr:PIN domain-containing protein [Candidatus Latescibacterota bacterium]